MQLRDAEKQAFSLSTQGKKQDRTKWLVDLNQIRQTTHHVVKGVLSRDQVDQVKVGDSQRGFQQNAAS